jgi:hypothetical protein
MTDEERKELKIYCFQRRLIASQVYGDDFIEKVKKAFAGVGYPNMEFFAGSAEHNRKCAECRELDACFTGKKWEDCLDDDEALRLLSAGHSLFHISVRHYFLPAYLIKLVKQARFSADYDFAQMLDDELIEWQKERISLLSSKQCEVIVKYLEITLKVWEGIENGYQDDVSTLNFWKKNYQKARDREIASIS